MLPKKRFLLFSITAKLFHIFFIFFVRKSRLEPFHFGIPGFKFDHKAMISATKGNRIREKLTATINHNKNNQKFCLVVNMISTKVDKKSQENTNTNVPQNLSRSRFSLPHHNAEEKEKNTARSTANRFLFLDNK